MAHTRGLEYEPGSRKIKGLAGTDLTAHLLYRIDATSNATITLAGAAALDCGVARQAAKSGQPVTLDCNGVLIVTSGEALATVGTAVKCNASGKVVAATVGTDFVIGVTRTPTASGADELISITKF
jgi:hypothetical protein